MAVAEHSVRKVSGGSFLIEDFAPEDIFTLEDLSPMQRQISQLTAEFAENEVLPLTEAIEAKDFSVLRRLMRAAGELGLLGVDTPEEYGGLAMDKVTSTLIADQIAVNASFAVTFAAQVGIGMLPLIWYGTQEQKEKYLPKLASGEWIAAYALSEASAGSDAMNIRTTAKLSSDGKRYLLNGEKMWISNAGLANIYTLFAKVDGEKFTAFLVERDAPGLTVGAEEHKLGIRGSSTCPLVLADCEVPVENVLGEIGKGHQIAFNVLNVGRFKLGAFDVGAARKALQGAVRYARERVAFGKPITSFGLVQEKIAECAADIYAGEAAVYRVVGAIDAGLADIDRDSPLLTQEMQSGIEEFAIEASMLKVWCSEMLARVSDQTLQMYGGYGFVEDYPAERIYRDARVDRIFEGTNEINRLIIVNWLMKRATQRRIDLRAGLGRFSGDGTAARIESGEDLRGVRELLRLFKQIALICVGAAAERYGERLAEQQEVMGAIADILMEVLVLESALLRTEKMERAKNGLAVKLTVYYAARSFDVVARAARRVRSALGDGMLTATHQDVFQRLTVHKLPDVIALGREIAEATVQAGRYTVS